ncbi:2-dehydropantoate 2-reductase [Cladophialophora yegresii CBS 114405]|uniref:2-dehydropantoate 2-reductase n=1 Tax=Cladophialophora yegresii CBS 114405 TaxID=1182544 RepID=W9WID6_9EURO|nr:2-dehydropantoate 2-reductase [Cladophialophora yegresii CBS 114405]EXJ58269.1 2-dehydropantoate 2-reductase [Cladophialophora yegresii CBS 114405]
MTSPLPRILVFGTGSVGAVYAWILSRAVTPSNIYCICRSNYTVASTTGFTINSTIFGQNLNLKPNVARTVEEAVSLLPSGDQFDYVVVTAKAIPSTPSIAEQLRPAVGPNTIIAVIQNGIAVEEPYAQLYPTNPLLSCVVYLPATQISPGVIVHKEIDLLHIGTYPSNSATCHPVAESFSALLTQGGGRTKVHSDVQAARFSKLLINAAWNPVCALSLSRDGEFLHASPPEISLNLIKSLMLEIAHIAQACGYDGINAETVEYQINRAKVRELPGVEPSMMADAKVHARMEVDAIVGNAVRLAESKGVETPLLRGIYALVKALDLSFAREREAKLRVLEDVGLDGESKT